MTIPFFNSLALGIKTPVRETKPARIVAQNRGAVARIRLLTFARIYAAWSTKEAFNPLEY
jgi:hypothetical protein